MLSSSQVLTCIQKSQWRKAPLQSHPLDWSTDCNPGFLVHVNYSEGFVHWLTIKKWPKLFPTCSDNERRKIQNRFHGQKMTHRSSVVLKSFRMKGQADLAPKDVSSSWGYWMVTDKPNTLHPVLFICSLSWRSVRSSRVSWSSIFSFRYYCVEALFYSQSSPLHKRNTAEDNVGHLSTGTGRLLGH